MAFAWQYKINVTRGHSRRVISVVPQRASVAPTDAATRNVLTCTGHIDLEHFSAPNQPARGRRTEGRSALLDSVAFDLEPAPTRPDNWCTTGRTVVLPPSSG